MIRSKARKFLSRFRRDEEGAVATIEFVVMVPLIFIAFMASMELSVYAIRNIFLDRGLDLTVRFIRLNTHVPMTHNSIKDMICDGNFFLTDCRSVLRLEMKPVNPRTFAGLATEADCVDLSEPVEPIRGFEPGQEHELMVLRACYMFKPLFPTTGLGAAFEKDGSGRVQMTSMNAFVQEPG